MFGTSASSVVFVGNPLVGPLGGVRSRRIFRFNVGFSGLVGLVVGFPNLTF